MEIIRGNKYLIVGIIVFLILLWWARYQVVPVHRIAGDDPLLNPLFLKLDRLTGKVEMINELAAYPPKSVDFEEWVKKTSLTENTTGKESFSNQKGKKQGQSAEEFLCSPKKETLKK